ncbi:hypothetical protein PR048_022361 [Dryococelus australis]|uniref:Ionotropic glutamate receptor C-terminal domain-containing protein n=1 Tax=Dryococelus australis TaxID=614101 RepID=A0ABQ9H0W0_9NEOP|nr:hypothetical protein PR048_022361 [Dryococelus australis]
MTSFIFNGPHSSDVFSDMFPSSYEKLSSSVIILDINQFQNWTDRFPGELAFSGSMAKIAGVVIFTMADMIWPSLKRLKSLPFWDPQVPFVLVSTSVVSADEIARTWGEFRVVNFLVVSQCAGCVGRVCEQTAACVYTHNQFVNNTSARQLNTDGSIKSVLDNKLKDLKGYEFSVLVTHSRNDWTSSQLPKRTAALTEVIRLTWSGATIVSVFRLHHRILLCWYLVFSLVMMNAYTGSLASYLTIPHYYPDINTLDELKDFGRAIFCELGGEENSIDGLFPVLDMNDPVTKTFLELFQLIDNMSLALYDISRYRNACVLTSKKDAEMIIQHADLYSEGYPLVHIMDVCPFSLKESYQFPELSPYTDIIDRHNERLSEGGFIVKWYEDDLRSSQKYLRNATTRNFLKPLGINHVSTSFFTLCVGLSVSAWGAEY